MPTLRLQTRLILLVLIPTLMMMLGLGISTVMARFQGLADVQQARSELILAKYHLIFEQITDKSVANLTALATAALEEEDIRSVQLVTIDGTPLLQAGPHPYEIPPGRSLIFDDQTRHYDTDESWIYVQPLDKPVLDHQGQAHVAWLILEFSTRTLTIRKYESLLMVAGICLAAMLLISMLLVRLVHAWLAPVQKMADTLFRIDSNHLDIRLNTDAVGDLSTLEIEINALLSRIAADTADLQDSMTQANEDLRQTMETMEVQNIELTLARKEAIEGNRIKSEFLANISHEIRTPLNGIIGFAKLLNKTSLTPRQADYVSTILKSSDSLLSIINGVLDLSKIEAGKLVLENVPMDIEEIIYDVLDMLAPEAEAKNIEQIAFIYDDVPRYLIGDSLRLKQIITNLVNNAVKFTESGQVIIRCMLEDQRDQRATIRVTVTDTGIGLHDSVRSELFQAFSQGDKSTTRKFGGTGLGLVISKHLVEQMHGDINFESEAGKGTTFWFTFRAEVDSHPQPESLSDRVKGHVVLVAESSPILRGFIENTLEHWGARSETLTHLEQMDSYQAQQFDGAIISLEWVKERGSVLTIAAKLMPLLKGPLLLLTRRTDAQQEQARLQDTGIVVTTKPIYPRALLNQLKPNQSQRHSLAVPMVSHDSDTPLHVLAVDDNPANLKLLSTLLEDMGVMVTQAHDGAEAVTLCTNNNYDLVFMDIQMPIMSGLEATLRIREFEQNTARGHATPIVALTAHAMGHEKSALLRAGMNDYLTKPIQESHIRHVLEKWTGRLPEIGPITQNPAPVMPDTTITNLDEHPVNWHECLQLAAGKPDLAKDMLHMLLKGLPDEKIKLTELLHIGDHKALLAAVHYVHGATRYCGVPALRDSTHHLETALKSETNLDEIRPLVESLFSAMDELMDWYQQHPHFPE